LEIDFLKGLDQETHDVEMAYTPGERIPEAAVPAGIPALLESALIEGNGRAFSLIIVAPGMPEEDFNVGSIRFHLYNHALRAWPLYLFIQAYPQS